jgi:hypothetical protein
MIVRETPDGVLLAGNRGTTIRTAVLGVLVDPNISNPLPFAGLSYVDLDVLGTGAQLNGFLTALPISRSSAIPDSGEAFRGYPGVGAALESAGPFRTLLSFEWGYGFKAVRSDGGRGTQAFRISAYRMF